MLHYATSVVFNIGDHASLALLAGAHAFFASCIPYMPWYTCGMAATPSTMLPLGTVAPPFALPDVVSGETISWKPLPTKKPC